MQFVSAGAHNWPGYVCVLRYPKHLLFRLLLLVVAAVVIVVVVLLEHTATVSALAAALLWDNSELVLSLEDSN